MISPQESLTEYNFDEVFNFLSRYVDFSEKRTKLWLFEYACQTAEYLGHEKSGNDVIRSMKYKLGDLVLGVRASQRSTDRVNLDDFLLFDDIPEIIEYENKSVTHIPVRYEEDYDR